MDTVVAGGGMKWLATFQAASLKLDTRRHKGFRPCVAGMITLPL